MFKLILLSFLILQVQTISANSSIYDYKLNTAKGKEINLSKYKGHQVLFVNIATKCGYTPQLDELEKLYKKYETKGLRVIGIPSNDFMGQTPEGDVEVVKFCKLKYGVTFPITSKVVVKGKSKTDFINHLVTVSGGEEIAWNFEKFLFNSKGTFVKRFTSSQVPLGGKIEESIKSLK